MTGFRCRDLGDGEQFSSVPEVRGWRVRQLELDAEATHFGYVYAGLATLSGASGEFLLQSGMYFALVGAGRVAGGSGIVLVQRGYRGLFLAGGPIEEHGRLRYIDGCTDTLLISPPRQGDPCLNLLVFPPGVDQTRHTHPSLRAGIVARGSGVCRTLEGSTPLAPGQVFYIPPGLEHAFATGTSGMTVIAWHPDSDHGPTDRDHPMINRTYIDGVSAASRR